MGLGWDQVESVLNICVVPQEISSIMKQMNWASRTKFRNKFIRPLIEEKLIELTIPDMPSS